MERGRFLTGQDKKELFVEWKSNLDVLTFNQLDDQQGNDVLVEVLQKVLLLRVKPFQKQTNSEMHGVRTSSLFPQILLRKLTSRGTFFYLVDDLREKYCDKIVTASQKLPRGTPRGNYS